MAYRLKNNTSQVFHTSAFNSGAVSTIVLAAGESRTIDEPTPLCKAHAAAKYVSLTPLEPETAPEVPAALTTSPNASASSGPRGGRGNSRN